MQPYYQDENAGITIYHADCREVLPTLGAVDLVLTDPPYGMNLDTANDDRWKGGGGRDWHQRKNWIPIEGDAAAFDPSHLLRFRRLVLFGANHYASRLPDSGGWIVWDKRDDMKVESTLSEAELAWTNLSGGVRVFRHKWFGLVRDSEIGQHWHPSQKPVALMRWIIERWTSPGDLVLDPYMGTGPIAQACKETGRRYIGIETERQYVEIAARRLSQEVMVF